MSALPEHRRILHGRTYSRSWHPCDSDPIERYRAPITQRVADALFATLLGICGAALLVHFLAR